MNLPKFLNQQGNALVYNQDNSTFEFYIPSIYFNNTAKVNIAEIRGQYVSSIGLFNWAIVDDKGKRGEVHLFNFPTMFLCKPSSMETVKNLKLSPNIEPDDYNVLKFKKGDEVVSQTRVPMMIDNVEMFFKMFIMTSKIPNSIPYNRLWELFFESARLNDFSYNLNVQLFAILIASLCRDKSDISKRFNETDMKNMNDYKLIDIRTVPKYISPYTAITSENWDESVRAAVLMKDKKNTPESPLEKVVTM